MPDLRNGNGNGRPPVSKWEVAMKSQRKDVLTWASAGAEDLLAAVAAATEDGAAVLLAKTSDGGALMLQVLLGNGQKPKFYAADMAELNNLLFTLAHIE